MSEGTGFWGSVTAVGLIGTVGVGFLVKGVVEGALEALDGGDFEDALDRNFQALADLGEPLSEFADKHSDKLTNAALSGVVSRF